MENAGLRGDQGPLLGLGLPTRHAGGDGSQTDGYPRAGCGVSLGVTSVQMVFKSIRLNAITRGMAADEKVRFRSKLQAQPRRLRIGNNCYWVSFKRVSFMMYKL